MQVFHQEPKYWRIFSCMMLPDEPYLNDYNSSWGGWMLEPNFMIIYPIALETFGSNPQMSTSWWGWGKSQEITRVRGIDPPRGKMNASTNFQGFPIVVEIFPSGPKSDELTNRPTFPSLKPSETQPQNTSIQLEGNEFTSLYVWTTRWMAPNLGSWDPTKESREKSLG